MTPEQLKAFNPTLYDIHTFIMDAEKLGYGEIEITVKAHDYKAKIVELKAVKPKKKTMPKSVTKRVMIRKEKDDKEGKNNKKDSSPKV